MPGKHNKTKRHGRIGTISIAIGIVLVVAAIALFAYNQWDDWRAGKAVADARDALVTAEYDGIKRPADGVMPTIEIDGWEYIGTLSLPRFGIELPVMNEWSYEGMRIAPGRYTGSVWNNDLVICGHNYERHFGNLRYLEEGDTVVFTDVADNVFNYTVHEAETLTPTAVEDMVTGDWDLTLFTCTIGGRARVAVRCMLADETEDAE